MVMVEVALVGYFIVMVAVRDCNVVILVVAFCKLLFVIVVGVM